MPARYLLRFDDICPSMNWEVWDRIELMLRQAGVRPLLAVVPDNRDPALEVNPPNPEFWSRVRIWRDLSWTIGMHGYRHEYLSRDPGILGLNPFSEFAGLPYEKQLRKLEGSLDIFRRQGVEPEVWIAPGHSFDQNTLAALTHIGLNTISDGYALWPYRDAGGLFWLPQQLWRFRVLPLGVWTVCFHVNGWSEAEIASFESAVANFRAQIMDVDSMHAEYDQRPCSPLDRAFSGCFRPALHWRRKLRRANPAAADA